MDLPPGQMADLDRRFVEHVRAAALFPEPGRALVAVSGGVDSVALLDLLVTAQHALRLELLVAHVDEDYTETIIARSRLDYVWVMARTPTIPAEDFERLRRQVADLGYDVNKLQKVPQRW